MFGMITELKKIVINLLFEYTKINFYLIVKPTS